MCQILATIRLESGGGRVELEVRLDLAWILVGFRLESTKFPSESIKLRSESARFWLANIAGLRHWSVKFDRCRSQSGRQLTSVRSESVFGLTAVGCRSPMHRISVRLCVTHRSCPIACRDCTTTRVAPLPTSLE